MNKIVNYGSINIDMVYSVESFVKAGETIKSRGVNTYPGGKGLNQSIALSKAGAETYHLGKIGSDGKWLLDLLRETGVHTQFVSENGVLTGTAIIQVSSQGNNAIIVNNGANGENTIEEIENALAFFGKGDVLLLQNESNDIENAIDIALSKEMVVALNPSPIDDNLLKLDLNKITYILLNEIEGKELSGETQPEEICKKLLQMNDKLKIVLTLGEKGVMYCDKEKRAYRKAEKVNVVDTTAAGDTFTGYFMTEMLKNSGVELALERATIASSIAISRSGAASSIPNISEVLLKCNN